MSIPQTLSDLLALAEGADAYYMQYIHSSQGSMHDVHAQNIRDSAGCAWDRYNQACEQVAQRKAQAQKDAAVGDAG